MKKTLSLTRRKMLQLTGTVGAGALLAACAPKVEETVAPVDPTVAPTVVPTEAAATAVPTEAASAPVSLTVYNPTGSFRVTQTFVPRLDTLDGKTIAFVSNDSWEADRTFPLIQQLLQERYPTATIITSDNFSHGTDRITVANSGLGEQLLEAGAQAAIVGNAG